MLFNGNDNVHRPQPPTLIGVVVISGEALDISWNLAPGALFFLLYTSVNGTDFAFLSFVYDMRYRHQNLAYGSTHYYKVRSRNLSDTPTSNYSNVAYGTTTTILQLIGDSSKRPGFLGSKKLNRGLSLFFNDRLWQFFKTVSRLMVLHVAKQQVYYYLLSEDTLSSRNKIYGLNKRKIWSRPKLLYGRIMMNPVRTDRMLFGTVSVHSIGLYFDSNHLSLKNVDVNKMVGNQILWDHKPFLVRDVKFFDRTMGLTDYKMTVLVTAVYTQD